LRQSGGWNAVYAVQVMDNPLAFLNLPPNWSNSIN
jgi:hypothetical protein